MVLIYSSMAWKPRPSKDSRSASGGYENLEKGCMGQTYTLGTVIFLSKVVFNFSFLCLPGAGGGYVEYCT